jgi:hypothetical protein
MSSIDVQPAPSFIGEADPSRLDGSRLRRKRRPWVVCCYAHIGAQYVSRDHTWRIPKQTSKQPVLLWKLIDFKIFATRQEAFESSSYGKKYAPFSSKNVLVLLRRNETIHLARRLGTIGLY